MRNGDLGCGAAGMFKCRDADFMVFELLSLLVLEAGSSDLLVAQDVIVTSYAVNNVDGFCSSFPLFAQT